jgi:hypothetical protein
MGVIYTRRTALCEKAIEDGGGGLNSISGDCEDEVPAGSRMQHSRLDGVLAFALVDAGEGGGERGEEQSTRHGAVTPGGVVGKTLAHGFRRQCTGRSTALFFQGAITTTFRLPLVLLS